MAVITPIQKNGEPVECPLCHENKLSLNEDIEPQIQFDLKKSPEIFYCYCYFCNNCGGMFFTIKNSTSAMKSHKGNQTIMDEFIKSKILKS